MAHIFICGDTGQTELLDTAADILRDVGHNVARGPKNEVGVVKSYSVRECDELIRDADVAVFTVRHECSRALMERARRLRGICFPVIGVETLDLDAANELGIIVGNGAVRGSIIGMAESTVMLILMSLYDVETTIRRMASGLWRHSRTSSRQVEGKTIGLIGFGRIAREVAFRLAPFGVRILTASPRVRQEDLPVGIIKADLDTVMRQSDVISILTGLTPETRHMIGPAQLALMKPDAHLINTGRGEVIDEDALCAHLRDHKIGGAALDTFTIEPLPADSPLRRLDNVILTPHCIGHTVDGAAEFVPAMLENIRRILLGELPLYCKNPEAEPAWHERLRGMDHP